MASAPPPPSASSHQSFKRHYATRLACAHRCRNKVQCKHACCKLTLPVVEDGDAGVSTGLPPMASDRASEVVRVLTDSLPSDVLSLILDFGVGQEYIALMLRIDSQPRLLIYDPIADAWSADEEIKKSVYQDTSLCLYQGRLATWKNIKSTPKMKGAVQFNIRTCANTWQTRVHAFGMHWMDSCLAAADHSLVALCRCHTGLYPLSRFTWDQGGKELKRSFLANHLEGYQVVLVTADRVYLHQSSIRTLRWCWTASGVMDLRYHDMKAGAALAELDADTLLVAGGYGSGASLTEMNSCGILSKDELDDVAMKSRPAARMNFDRTSHCLVKAEGSVYAIGGRRWSDVSGEAIEMYDAHADRWIVKADLFPDTVRAASAAWETLVTDVKRRNSRSDSKDIGPSVVSASALSVDSHEVFNLQLARKTFEASDACVVSI